MREIQKVMLVDDEQDIRTVAELSLKHVGGWDTLLLPSGQEALESAPLEQPDVILLDVMMPELDGPTTLERLRRDERTVQIPVIFMTAKVQTHEVEAYHELGAVGVIAKPFDPMELPGEVRRILLEREAA